MGIFRRVKRAVMRRLRAVTKPRTAITHTAFTLHQYAKADGTFDYEKYRSIQNAGNQRKLGNVFADQTTINFVADYLVASGMELKRGICHGTRRGMEQAWFAERLSAEVIGTDIADSAANFPNTVQWDFHDTNPEWVGQFDFVYTNSHDHAYDPEKALLAWSEQLRDGGKLVLEHTTMHTEDHASELDPLGVQPLVLPYAVAKWGKGRFYVTDILEPPFKKPSGASIWLFVIERKSRDA